jgi:predicted XRE-type DNA-binding protein
MNSIGIVEYNIFYKIITGFIYYITRTVNFDYGKSISTGEHFYKTRKLRQEDPLLYDLKRYDTGNNEMVYARYCQQNRQPVIHTDKEMRDLSAAKKAALIKYWNFTKKKPAYYSCPTKEYPVLSFIIGKHPKGYCLPCCTKKIGKRGKKDTKIISCLQNYEYKEEATKTIRLIEFGKKVEPGRLTHVPRILHKLFYNIPDNTLCIISQKQNYQSVKCGTLYSLSYLLKQPISTIIKRVSTLYTNDKLFSTLLGGAISAYFTSFSEFKTIFNDIYVLGRVSIIQFDWNELMAELIGLAYNLDIYMFSADDKLQLSQIKNSMVGDIEDTFILITYKKAVNPIVDALLDVNGVSVNKLNSSMISKLKSICSTSTIKLNIPTGYREITQYINKSGLCYARIYERDSGTDKKVYFPVVNEPIKNNISAIYDDFNPTGFSLIALRAFLAKEISTLVYYVLKDNNKVVSVKSSFGFHHIEPTPISELGSDDKTKTILYDPVVVNHAILSNQPAETTLNITKALYDNYQYRLFVVEFANYIDQERNMKIRNAIYNVIKEHDFRKEIEQIKKEVRHILGDYQADLSHLINQILSFFHKKMAKDTLIAQIKNTVYKFDKMTLSRIFAMNHGEVVALLREIAGNFAVERALPADDAEFPNIYVSCQDNQANYCDGKRLIVSNLNEMIQFLADDLTNELKRQYFLANIWLENYIDYFSFATHSREKVQIFQ